MATLTETTFYTRKLIKYGTFILIGLLGGKLLLDISLTMWRKLHPPPPPPPTVSFGKLPKIEFPEKEKISGLEFQLETPTGTLPEFPDRAKVYFMPYLRPNLLALDRAKKQAALMGFRTEPKAISEKIYKWTKVNDGIFSLEMDIFSGSFIFSYDWQNDQTILLGKNLPGKEEAKREGQNFLKKAQILEKDLLEGRMGVFYFKPVGGKLVPAVSPSEASFAKVEMFRKNIDELPVLTPDPGKGIVSILISGSREYEKKVVRVESNYFPVKYDSWGTYPIKTSAAAWQELKAGKGFIARWDGSGNKVIIRRVYLAYFDSPKPQEFLQPIIVFEGDNNFFAYVPAVTPEWNL